VLAGWTGIVVVAEAARGAAASRFADDQAAAEAILIRRHDVQVPQKQFHSLPKDCTLAANGVGDVRHRSYRNEVHGIGFHSRLVPNEIHN
jgi:hypothetical protein